MDLARLARERLRLERVLLAPAGVQPLKSGTGGENGPGASWEERLQMVTLAVEGVEGLEASAVDAPRESGRPNYSAETVARLAEELAGDGEGEGGGEGGDEDGDGEEDKERAGIPMSAKAEMQRRSFF